MSKAQKATPKENKYDFDELRLLREFYQIMIEKGVVPDLLANLLVDDMETYAELIAVGDALSLIDAPDRLPFTWHAYHIDNDGDPGDDEQ